MSLQKVCVTGLGEIGVEQPHPRFVKGSKEQHFVRVAAGAGHSLALTSSGQVWSCGQGSFGTLGMFPCYHNLITHSSRCNSGLYAYLLSIAAVPLTDVPLTCGGSAKTMHPYLGYKTFFAG